MRSSFARKVASGCYAYGCPEERRAGRAESLFAARSVRAGSHVGQRRRVLNVAVLLCATGLIAVILIECKPGRIHLDTNKPGATRAEQPLRFSTGASFLLGLNRRVPHTMLSVNALGTPVETGTRSKPAGSDRGTKDLAF